MPPAEVPTLDGAVTNGDAAHEVTLSQRFHAVARRHAARTAISGDAGAMTFAELDSTTNRLAARIIACSDAGDRIALLMRHDAPLIVAVLATLKAGRIVVVLNPSDPPLRMEQVVRDAEPAVIVADDVHHQIATSLMGDPTRVLACELAAKSAAVDPLSALPQVGVRPDDVAWLVYTSGSTGTPRAVMQTHRSIGHNAWRLSHGMGLRSDDRIALLGALSGGQGVATTWCGLLTGATLFPYDIRRRGIGELSQWIRDNSITTLVASATVFRHFIQTLAVNDQFPSVRLVRLASEPATSQDAHAWRRHFASDCMLVNTLSSSETGNITQWMLRGDERIPDGRLPIGRAAAGLEVSVRDENGRDVADGECGELIVRSRYIAAGYWRNDDLTAQRFATDERDRTLRTFSTGDLVRREHDGTLAYMGRRDARVKVRGHRVEPGEVEEAIRRLPGVGNAAVCVRSCADDEMQLVAYVTSDSDASISSDELRRGLRDVLPAHMIPSAFVALDAVPLTPTGKIDRERLRSIQPASDSPADQEPLVTATQELLGEIWSKVFGGAAIGRLSDFFDLGGDSLTAAVVAARVQAARGVRLDLGAFIESPTLEALAAHIDQAVDSNQRARSQPPLVRVARGGPLPISFSEERTWRHAQSPATNASLTVACRHVIRGPLDVDAFRLAVNRIVCRHEALRTTYHSIHGVPRQIVHAPRPQDIPLIDLSDAPDAEKRAADLFAEEARKAFDLSQLPLLRLVLIRLRRDEHVLLRLNHHINSDPWSWKVFFRELGELYAAYATGREPPLRANEPLHAVDYAVWQRRCLRPDGPLLTQEVEWWKQRLAGSPPSLRLPFERPTPLTTAAAVDGVMWWGVKPETTQSLVRIARMCGATYHTIRLAAFAAVLAEETGQHDLVLGGYFTNRQHEHVQGMFGFFSNLATLRLKHDRSRTLAQWLSVVRGSVGETQAHSELPYERLGDALRLEGSPPPEIRAIFSTAEHNETVRFGGLEVTWAERRMQHMPWGFTISFDQHNEERQCRADFDARQYDPAGVRRFLNRLARLLAEIARQPHRTIGGLCDASLIAEPTIVESSLA